MESHQNYRVVFWGEGCCFFLPYSSSALGAELECRPGLVLRAAKGRVGSAQLLLYFVQRAAARVALRGNVNDR